MSEITRVGVLGCGQMGSGIAHVAATAGFSTIVRDVEAGMLAKGQGAIRKSLDKLVDKGRVDPAARDAALEHLTFTTRLGDLDTCDLVIEAVTEDLQLKTELWRALDASAPAPTIFASNTSSLSIGDMAVATGRPDRFVGLHFFTVDRTVTVLREHDRHFGTDPGAGRTVGLAVALMLHLNLAVG